MSPLRLIIIAILIYIGYLLIKGSGKRLKKGKDEGELISDVLVEDPVCKKFVPRQQAETLKREGKTYYFCSDECRSKFDSQQGAE